MQGSPRNIAINEVKRRSEKKGLYEARLTDNAPYKL